MLESVSPDKRLGQLDQRFYQRRQVKFKTCSDVYNYWRAYKRLYKKAPKDGVEFQVDYIDTGLALSEEKRATAPIALALHGAPGSYHDFTLLIHHLSQQNVRIIAPNFPEYVATVKTNVLFRHSADEKAAYLRDFLKAINVNKIDLLVSHSSAIFPTLLILLNANNEAISRRQLCRKDNAKLVAQTNSERINAKQDGHCGKENKVAWDEDREEREESGCFNDDDQQDEDEESAEKFEDAQAELDNNNNNNNQEVKKQTATCQGVEDKAELVAKRRRRGNRIRGNDVIVEFEQPIEIKAVALFNPAGHRLPKSMKPTWFKCGSVRVYQHKLGRSLFRKLGPSFLTVIGVPVRVDNMDNVMLSATVMRNSRCQRVVNQLEQLSQMKLPTLLVFSENDKLIEKEIFYEMTQFMKLDHKNFDVFNNDGDIELSRKYKLVSPLIYSP